MCTSCSQEMLAAIVTLSPPKWLLNHVTLLLHFMLLGKQHIEVVFPSMSMLLVSQ